MLVSSKLRQEKFIVGIVVKWQSEEKTIIYTQFQDPWILEHFIEMRKRWHQMIKSVDYIIPIILDFRETFDAPEGILHHFIAIHRTPHPRQGHIIVFGLNPLYQKLSKHLFDGAITQTKQVKFVSSFDEAVMESLSTCSKQK